MMMIEMRNTGNGQYGNGLIARGYIRESVRLPGATGIDLRGWARGTGRIMPNAPRGVAWNRFEASLGGVQ